METHEKHEEIVNDNMIIDGNLALKSARPPMYSVSTE